MTHLTEIDGLPVIDAKEPIELHISAGDIANADLKDPSDCVVARACRRDLHVKEARVHLGRIYLRVNKGNWLRYLTPRPLRSEIISFDRGGTFEPADFTLAAPYPKARLGKRTGGASRNARPRPGPKTKRRKPHVVTNVRNGPA